MIHNTINIFYLRDTNKLCGPGKTIINTFRTIDKEKFSLIISSTITRKNSINEFLEYAKKNGAVVEPLRVKHSVDIIAISRLVSLLRHHNIQILQTHDAQTRRIGFIASFLAGVTHVTSLHGWIQNTFKQKLSVLVDKFVLRFSGHIIVMSQKMKKEIVSMGIPSSKISVLYNSILLDDYPVNLSSEKIRREYQIHEKDEKVVAMIGRLSAEKGPDIFVEMAHRLLQKYSKVKFLLVGDGPLFSTIQRKVAHLGLQKHVILTGHRTDMDHVYAAIDILAIPSFSEGLPNVLLEASVYSKPVVSTRVGGIPEIISHGINGFLVEPGRVDDLVDYVLFLLKDPDLMVQMGSSARRIIEDKFDFRKRTEILEKLYESIVVGATSDQKHA